MKGRDEGGEKEREKEKQESEILQQQMPFEGDGFLGFSTNI